MMLLACVLFAFCCGCSCYHKDTACHDDQKAVKNCEHTVDASRGVQTIPYITSTEMFRYHMTDEGRERLQRRWDQQSFAPLT